MNQQGTGYRTARTADYGSAPSIDHDYGAGSAPVVSFVNVSKHYGRLKAVDGLSLDLRAGETVALLGPNGAGKSTSLDMLLALRKPTSGKIQMFGSDPYHAVKSGRVGAMLQSGGLMPEVTVRELVTLVTSLHPRPEPVAVTLKRAGIAQFADQRVDRLSGGQTQRVRFALAICGKSELVVLWTSRCPAWTGSPPPPS
jgi:ABC-2 type transport system ATP-binding protein